MKSLLKLLWGRKRSRFGGVQFATRSASMSATAAMGTLASAVSNTFGAAHTKLVAS
jgi:hypothetical protein